MQRYLIGKIAAEFNKLKNNSNQNKMNKFAVAAIMAVGIYADNHWSKLTVQVDGSYKGKYI